MINPALPVSWKAVARAEEIPEGKGKLVREGRLELLVFHTKETWTAFDNTCPHAGAPIYAEHFDGERVTCIYHGLQFSAKDGSCVGCAGWSLDPYLVKEEGGQVLVGFPVRGSGDASATSS